MMLSCLFGIYFFLAPAWIMVVKDQRLFAKAMYFQPQ